jgi:peptide/nickel transport system substrate-binding protein
MAMTRAKNIKWWEYCILPVICVLFNTGCSNPIDKNEHKQVFHLNLSSGNLESMDPAFAKDLYMMWTAHMVYNTLLETNDNLQLSPSLAKSWETSEDRLSYTFHLRDDVYFHDAPEFENGKGRKMTAHDVEYSLGRIIDPKVASYGAWIFNGRVDEHKPFEAVDDTTFVLHLKEPFQPMLQILSMQYCSIVPREVVEHWGKDYRSHACGTGPFKFKYWDEGNILVLHKNEHYWEKDNTGHALPYIDAVQISFVDSKATEYFLFLQGKLDFVNGVDGSFKDLVLTKKGELKKDFTTRFRLDKQTYLNTEYVGFLTDTTNPIMYGSGLNNVLVRRAINYAIDRKKIVTYFRNGVGYPALGGFIPAGLQGHDASYNFGYKYDPAKASALLKQAGYPHGKGLKPFAILTPDNWSDVINFIVSQLQDVGIPASTEIIQPNILKQQMSRSLAVAFRGQWLADYPDGETYLAVFNSKLPAPPNYTRFNNSNFDKLYDESMKLPDTARWDIYRTMDSLAMSEAPVIPLFYDQILHFTQNRITGLRSNAMNLIDLKQVMIK